MQKNNVYANLNTRGTTQDDVILAVYKSVKATVTIPVGKKVGPAEPLVSVDGGKTFVPAFIEEFDPTKADYKTNHEVVHGGRIFKALVDDPTVDSTDDNEKWSDMGAYVINGAAMITFEREAPQEEESFDCAVAVDCELLSQKMPNFSESSRVAGFPTILMK